MRITHLSVLLLFFVIAMMFPAFAAAQYDDRYTYPRYTGYDHEYDRARQHARRNDYRYDHSRSYSRCDQQAYRYQSGCYNHPPRMERPRYREPYYASYPPPRPMYRPRQTYYAPRYGPPPRYSHRHDHGCRGRPAIHFRISFR